MRERASFGEAGVGWHPEARCGTAEMGDRRNSGRPEEGGWSERGSASRREMWVMTGLAEGWVLGRKRPYSHH